MSTLPEANPWPNGHIFALKGFGVQCLQVQAVFFFFFFSVGVSRLGNFDSWWEIASQAPGFLEPPDGG